MLNERQIDRVKKLPVFNEIAKNLKDDYEMEKLKWAIDNHSTSFVNKDGYKENLWRCPNEIAYLNLIKDGVDETVLKEFANSQYLPAYIFNCKKFKVPYGSGNAYNMFKQLESNSHVIHTSNSIAMEILVKMSKDEEGQTYFTSQINRYELHLIDIMTSFVTQKVKKEEGYRMENSILAIREALHYMDHSVDLAKTLHKCNEYLTIIEITKLIVHSPEAVKYAAMIQEVEVVSEILRGILADNKIMRLPLPDELLMTTISKNMGIRG